MGTQLTPEAQSKLEGIAQDVRTKLREAGFRVVEVGIKLLEARKIIGAGKAFETWCLEKLSLSQATAYRWTASAQRFTDWGLATRPDLLDEVDFAEMLAPSFPVTFSNRVTAGGPIPRPAPPTTRNTRPEGPTMTTMPADPCVCQDPQHFSSGLKGVLAHVVEGVIESGVERCDACETFHTDEAAEAALVAHLHKQGLPGLHKILVKLEYSVLAPSTEEAVDALTSSILLNARTTVGITRTANLLRTDVRHPGEVGD